MQKISDSICTVIYRTNMLNEQCSFINGFENYTGHSNKVTALSQKITEMQKLTNLLEDIQKKICIQWIPS